MKTGDAQQFEGTSGVDSGKPADGGAGGGTGGGAGGGPGGEIGMTLPGKAIAQERWLWRALLVLMCLLAYSTSFSSKFIWDDGRHAGMTSLRDYNGLVSIWTKLGLENGGTPQYYPLTHTTFWLEEKVFGRNPVGYRVVNVLVHAGGAIVLWELLRRLGVRGAFLAAAVFAVHPMMVESVAWTSERKNTLSLLLGLTSLLLYARFAGIGDENKGGEKQAEPDWNFYVLAVLAFAGAMLSKTMAASIPVLMLLGLWWKGKLTARHVGLVAPMLVVALGLGLLTGYVEHRYVIRPGGGNVHESFVGWLGAKLTGGVSAGPDFEVAFFDRLKLAGVVPWFYASKLVAPVDLMFFYPRWDLAAAPAWWWLGWVGTLGVLGGAVVQAMRGRRWAVVVVVGYLVALFPAMGFVDVYPFRYSYVAEHFAYHAVWLLIAAGAAGVATLWVRVRGEDGGRPQVVLAAGAALCLVLGARTYVHAGHFIDNYALFTHTLSRNPASWAASTNLAIEYIRMSEIAKGAEGQYIKQMNTARLDGNTKGVEELAREVGAAKEEGNQFLVKARELLNNALVLRPNHEWVHHNLGKVAALEGKLDESLEFFQESVRRRKDPTIARDGTFPETLMNIGDLLVIKGDFAGGAAAFRQAIAAEDPPLKPAQPGPRLSLLRNINRVLTAEKRRPTPGETAEIETTARQLSELAAKNEEAWLVIGDSMQKIGKLNDAVVAYREAISVNVGSVRGYLGMGYLMGLAGDLKTSEVALTEALRLDPNNAQAKMLLEQVQQAATRPTTREGN